MKKKTLNLQNQPDLQVDGKWVRSYNTTDVEFFVCNHTRAGTLWGSLLRRSKEGRTWKIAPRYEGCANVFKDFQHFAEWCQDQYGYLNKEVDGTFWSIDKDILVPGNKLYGPDTCCFVPKEVNGILTFNKTKNNDLPVGVFKLPSGSYQSSISIKGKTKYLGVFPTADDAYFAWKTAKIDYTEQLLAEHDHLPEKVIQAIRNHMTLL